MDIALSVAAFLLSIVGIVGCIVPALPGVVLSYAGLLCAYFTSYSSMSPAAIWLWLAITVAVSVADYFLPAWMTRRFGGSRSGAIGATVGVFAGFFFFPPVGIILGPFFGAVLGELGSAAVGEQGRAIGAVDDDGDGAGFEDAPAGFLGAAGLLLAAEVHQHAEQADPDRDPTGP